VFVHHFLGEDKMNKAARRMLRMSSVVLALTCGVLVLGGCSLPENFFADLIGDVRGGVGGDIGSAIAALVTAMIG
jgi:hypothetical protein